MATTKTPITVRMDPVLLKQIKQGAARENRTVTNFIETALREQLGANSRGGSRKAMSRQQRAENDAK